MGEVFAGRVELLEPIGQGGMGSVWLAHDRRADQLVAAKVLRHSDAASLLRFVRETSLRVDHPHVVAPLGWMAEDDRVVFTMRLVQGGSVASLIGDFGALPPVLVAELLRQLLDALSAVHGADLVHRDVTPANLLLDPTRTDRPHLYLSDFGVAAEVDGPRLTRVSHVVGTLGYLAPEQLAGADPHPAQDMYAVGQVAAEMLTGRRPDPRSGPIASAPRPLGVPEALWSLVVDLTGADPDARPTVAQAAERLTDPQLTWREGGTAPVEVLRHVELPEELSDRFSVPVPPTEAGTGVATGGTAQGGVEGAASAEDPATTQELSTEGTAYLGRETAAPEPGAAGAEGVPARSDRPSLTPEEPASRAGSGRGPAVVVLLVVMLLAALVLAWALWGLASS